MTARMPGENLLETEGAFSWQCSRFSAMLLCALAKLVWNPFRRGRLRVLRMEGQTGLAERGEARTARCSHAMCVEILTVEILT